jgi:FtsP/CotA-like multicopper oxidase with cupredoxin domain
VIRSHRRPLVLAAPMAVSVINDHWRRIAIAATVLLLLSGLVLRASSAAVPPPPSGIVCTESPTQSFSLTTRTGFVSVPDGNSIFMWSFSPGNGAFQLPGPTLCVPEDSTVTIVLHNTLPEPVSLIFPGQAGVQANGALSEPQFDLGGNLTSLAPSAAATNGTMTYSFVASEPGTYLYQSGTDMAKQVQMGLFGALVVRPAGHPSWAYNRADSAFNPDAEYVMLMSEVDPALHQAVERHQAFDWTAYHPRYWMLNGRSFPDTIAPNGAPWLPSQPYSSMVHIQPYDESTNPYPALARYINVGTLNHPFHPHGNDGRVIARDGRPLEASPGAADTSFSTFLVLVGSGQTWDALYDWRAERALGGQGWDPTSYQVPQLPQLQNLTFKDDATWYGGSPYLGLQDELPVGTTTQNECGEYYHMWHSHALNEAANFDAGFGGMTTLERVDPPGGCP